MSSGHQVLTINSGSAWTPVKDPFGNPPGKPRCSWGVRPSDPCVNIANGGALVIAATFGDEIIARIVSPKWSPMLDPQDSFLVEKMENCLGVYSSKRIPIAHPRMRKEFWSLLGSNRFRKRLIYRRLKAYSEAVDAATESIERRRVLGLEITREDLLRFEF